jgi:MFS family permease
VESPRFAGNGAAAANGVVRSAADQAAAILADCRKQRARAIRWIAAHGILAAALVAGVITAAIGNHYHGALVFLVPVLLVMNLARLGQCLKAFGKIRRAEQIVRDAQAHQGF